MINGRMYLGGGGEPQVSFRAERDFFSQLPSMARILYVPIALKRSAIGYEGCYDWFASLLALHAEDRDVDFTMLLSHDPIPSLGNFDAVYVGGGNTYRLLQYMRESGFASQVASYLTRGGLYFGGSAGAMVLGKDVRTVREENDASVSVHAGLNLLDEQSVYCHYDTGKEMLVRQRAKETGTTVIAVPEDSCVVYENGQQRVIGRAFKIDAERTEKI